MAVNILPLKKNEMHGKKMAISVIVKEVVLKDESTVL